MNLHIIIAKVTQYFYNNIIFYNNLINYSFYYYKNLNINYFIKIYYKFDNLFLIIISYEYLE